VHVREFVGWDTEKRRSDPQRETNPHDDELRGQWPPERSLLRTGYDHFAVGSPDHIYPPVRENAEVAVRRAPTLASPETLDDAPERWWWSTFAIGQAVCGHQQRHPTRIGFTGRCRIRSRRRPLRCRGSRGEMSETTAATRSNAVSASGGVPYPRR
jgi:hypothetical protein